MIDEAAARDAIHPAVLMNLRETGLLNAVANRMPGIARSAPSILESSQ